MTIRDPLLEHIDSISVPFTFDAGESEEDEGDASDDKDEDDLEAEEEAAHAERRQSHAQAGPANEAAPGGDAGKGAFFAQTPDGTRFAAGSFNDLHLSRPLLKACAALGYTNPTPIQVCLLTLILKPLREELDC